MTTPDPVLLAPLLERAARSHPHLCPRMVLGVRMGLAGPAAIGLAAPREDKRLLVLVETDGCFVSGVEASTGAAVGRRTLRVEDYGRVAATFVDVETGRAARVAPHPSCRTRALEVATAESRRWFAMRDAYQRMPDEELLRIEAVTLVRDVREIVSRPHARALCAACGEEVINEREVVTDGRARCRACAGGAYYRAAPE